MNHGIRIRFGMLLTVVALGLIVMVAFSQQEKEAAIDTDVYNEFLAGQVADIAELQQYFYEQQAYYLRILPPDDDFILNQSGLPSILPFSWKAFPENFLKGLTVEYENSAPVYPITILEDSSRETVFLNENGKKFYSLPPADDDVSSHLETFPQSFCDPTRIRISVKLVPSEYVEPFLYVSERISEESALSALASGGGEGSMLLMYPDTNNYIFFKAFSRVANGLKIVIGFTNSAPIGNYMDVFTSGDLMEYTWAFAQKGLSTTGATEITWVDTNYWVSFGPPVRHYAAANTSDEDGDSYSDASELWIYHTSPTNNASRPFGVSGTVSYNGIETGTIYVAINTSSVSWSIAQSVTLAGPGVHSNDVGNSRSYHVKAFRDVNVSYERDVWEPYGIYSNNPLYVANNNLTGINITMQDQPSVWGSLSYTGSVDADIWVIAATTQDCWNTTYRCVIPWIQGVSEPSGSNVYVSFPVDYAITGLPVGNYMIRAFVDSDTPSNTMNGSELAGQYWSAAIAVSNRRTGITFALQDPCGASGVVSYATYSGGQTGPIHIVAVSSSNNCSTNFSCTLAQTGAYQIANLPLGTYWLWAWRDSDGNDKTCGMYEARGHYTNCAILITSKLVNINIVLHDPDSDGDGMGDWWEFKKFFGLQQPAMQDYDGDHLMNLLEYIAGTDPTAGFEDADGDGMSDDWEWNYGLNRYDSNDANLDLDQDGFTNLEEYEAQTVPSDPLSHPAGAYYVATNGVNTANRGSYTNPFATISYALTQSTNGHRIILFPGVYTNTGNYGLSIGKYILLTGLQGCRDTTIVDCQNNIYFANITTASNVMRYLTICNAFYGGISFYGANISLLSCTFKSNSALYNGGAVYVPYGSLTAEDCLFEGNHVLYPSGSKGGALSLAGEAHLSRCRFINNSAANGGAIDTTALLELNSCLLKSNTAGINGGAIYSSVQGFGAPALYFANCTFADNYASTDGGAFYTHNNMGGFAIVLINCIVWGNVGDPVVVASVNMQYSCVQWAAGGQGNINTNPLFGSDGGHLSPLSPCRNSGLFIGGMDSQFDVDGQPRINDGVVDIGADELDLRYAAVGNSSPSAPYSSWATAATTLQQAVDCTLAWGYVMVSNGIYSSGSAVPSGGSPCRVALTNFIGLMSVNGATATVIKGVGPRGAGAVRCAYVGSNSSVSGFTLNAGSTYTSGDTLSQDGGGAWCDASGLLLNCVITNCSARYGGGVYGGRIAGSMLKRNAGQSGGGAFNCIVEDTLFYSNTVTSCGGGAYGGSLQACWLYDNRAISGGGAYAGFVENSILKGNNAIGNGGGANGGQLFNCRIESNKAASGGGAFNGYVETSELIANIATNIGGGALKGTLRSCLVAGNSATIGGGVCSSVVENCTISDNAALQSGGTHGCATKNSIIYFNSPTNWSGGSFTNCCAVPLPAGSNNIFCDPGFCGRSTSNYSLRYGSACYNAGLTESWMTNALDVAGQARVVDAFVDMGAYEYDGFYLQHMPSYDQSNTWGITVAGVTTRVWLAAFRIASNQLPLVCWFKFGDGQQSETVTVAQATTARYIGASHAYATAALYQVSAYLRYNPGVTITQTFLLSCRAGEDFDARISHSIEDGLIWLYTNALTNSYGYYWQHDNFPSYIASANGMALTAFAAFGHTASLTNDVYADIVEGGLRDTLSARLAATEIYGQCNYDPDANENDLGITSGSNEEMYEIGSLMTAIIGAGQPEDLAPISAPPDIANRSYQDIVQDMADYCGWAQYDSGTNRGGWRYRANESPDNSASFWPVLGLSCSAKWDILVPYELKDELTNWVAYSQSGSGGFGYTDASEPMLARTACGLAQLAFIGRSVTNAAVKSALNYIASCTNRIEDVNNLYGMHAYASACDIFDPSVEMVGTQSWRYICATGLLARQYSDGSWTGHCHDAEIGRVFGTASAIAILAATAPMRVFLQKYDQVPCTVYSNNTVHIRAFALPRTDISNLTFSTWYRAGTNVSFTSIGMTNSANVYYTTNAIPAKPASTKVEYYLRAIYQYSGTTTTQRYPSAHSGDFFSYTVSSP